MLCTVLDALDDGVLVCDDQGHILFASKRLAEVWHLAKTPAAGSLLSDLTATLDALGVTAGQVHEVLRKAIPGERSLLRLRDDRVVECVSQSSHYGSGPVRVWAFRDVTTRAALEERTRHSLKLEAIGRLAAGIAHEFNNVLFTITSACDLIRLGTQGSLPNEREVVEIESAASRAANLTQRLVAFSRQQVLRMEVLDLNEVVSGLQKMLGRLLGEHIVFTCNLAPKVDPILADRQGIEQILLNLAANARDAMPDGGRFTIATANVVVDDAQARLMEEGKPGAHVLLAVSDTGKGLDDDARAHVFEPFFTTKPQVSGAGLGLASVHGIVRQHLAQVLVSSTRTHGTAFEIYFRRHAAPRSDACIDVTRQVIPSRGEVILLAEDQDLPRDAACRALDAAGYRILAARDGQEALEMADRFEGPIRLLITDVLMPRLNGPELYRRLLETRPGMRVVFVSGDSEGLLDDDGNLLFGDDFLEKPFSLRVMVKRVRDVLDRP